MKFITMCGMFSESYKIWLRAFSTSLQVRSRFGMKIVWKVTLRSYETKTFPMYQDLACWQARSLWPGCFSHMNITFPLSGITFCCVSNFSIQLMFSATSQPEILSGKWDNVSPYEQNKSIWLVEKFSRSIWTGPYTGNLYFLGFAARKDWEIYFLGLVIYRPVPCWCHNELIINY
jgi:hypothetical protein